MDCEQLCFTYINIYIYIYIYIAKRWVRGVMIEGLDCGIVVWHMKLPSRYYVQFWTATLG